jgi:hypothetical protein
MTCGVGLQAGRRARVSVKRIAINAGDTPMTSQAGIEPDRINVADSQARLHWARKLDATEDQLREAVRAVGDKAADVEMHLKGSHSTTNSDRVSELGEKDRG